MFANRRRVPLFRAQPVNFFSYDTVHERELCLGEDGVAHDVQYTESCYVPIVGDGMESDSVNACNDKFTNRFTSRYISKQRTLLNFLRFLVNAFLEKYMKFDVVSKEKPADIVSAGGGPFIQKLPVAR